MLYIKKFDMLSPPITLYFKGEDQHHSIFSAILSIIAYVLVVAAAIYYFLGFINKDNPKAYFFTRYIEDAGQFPVNSTSMFNYLQFIDKYDNTKLGFDFSVLRAVGVNSVYYEQYMNDPEVIANENHWVYGPCNDNTDVKGIEDLIDPYVYQNAACIREYYNKEENKYYKTGEKGFEWPVVEHGCSNPKSTFYGIIVQRCDQAPNSLRRSSVACKSSEEISEAISKLSFKYQIIDHYADVLNYNKPFTKYFYEVASAVQDGIYIINHLNFNPADMLTHNGIFFDNQIKEHSYFFTQNEKHTIDSSTLPEGETTRGCLMGVYFWMQNTLQHYERNYDRFQDLLSDIGGISSIITTIGYYINLLINYYIALVDTEELIIKRDELNYGGERKQNKRPTFLRKVNQMENPPRRPYRKNTSQKDLSTSNNKKLNPNNLDEYNKNDEVDIYYNRRALYRRGANNEMDNKYYDINNNPKTSYPSSSQTNNMNNENKVQENEGSLGIKNQNFNWFKYFWYLICCRSNDKMISYYENLRSSLISEENIIQNYLDIYKLLKINGIEKKDIFNNIK